MRGGHTGRPHARAKQPSATVPQWLDGRPEKAKKIVFSEKKKIAADAKINTMLIILPKKKISGPTFSPTNHAQLGRTKNHWALQAPLR